MRLWNPADAEQVGSLGSPGCRNWNIAVIYEPKRTEEKSEKCVKYCCEIWLNEMETSLLNVIDSVDMSFSWLSHGTSVGTICFNHRNHSSYGPIWPWPGEGAPFVGVFCHSGPQLSWVAECWHFGSENSMNSAEQCENPAEKLCLRLFVRVLAWIELWWTWKIPKLRMWQVAGSKMVTLIPWSELFGVLRPCAWIGRRCVGPARRGEAIRCHQQNPLTMLKW